MTGGSDCGGAGAGESHGSEREYGIGRVDFPYWRNTIQYAESILLLAS